MFLISVGTGLYGRKQNVKLNVSPKRGVTSRSPFVTGIGKATSPKGGPSVYSFFFFPQKNDTTFHKKNMFLISVGTDLYGRKQNVKLEFPTCPTMTELINSVESQFDVMSRASRPAAYPDVPYKVQTFQVYDDILLRWVDLYSSAQLTNGCQVFCFQPETIWHSDAQGIIPEAKDGVTWSTRVGSPRRGRVATDAGVAPVCYGHFVGIL